MSFSDDHKRHAQWSNYRILNNATLHRKNLIWSRRRPKNFELSSRQQSRDISSLSIMQQQLLLQIFKKGEKCNRNKALLHNMSMPKLGLLLRLFNQIKTEFTLFLSTLRLLLLMSWDNTLMTADRESFKDRCRKS